jgi:hypothetical protein
MQSGEVQHRLLLGAPMRGELGFQIRVQPFEIVLRIPREDELVGVQPMDQRVPAAGFIFCHVIHRLTSDAEVVAKKSAISCDRLLSLTLGSVAPESLQVAASGANPLAACAAPVRSFS